MGEEERGEVGKSGKQERGLRKDTDRKTYEKNSQAEEMRSEKKGSDMTLYYDRKIKVSFLFQCGSQKEKALFCCHNTSNSNRC